MLFKVYSFSVKENHRPDKKHGVDDHDYMGAYKTPFKYRNVNLDSRKVDNKKYNKLTNDTNLGIGGVNI